VAPTWTEIGQLTAIAALRTALNAFIQPEIDAAERRRGQGSRPTAEPSGPRADGYEASQNHALTPKTTETLRVRSPWSRAIRFVPP
jgi:hypothetical protein